MKQETAKTVLEHVHEAGTSLAQALDAVKAACDQDEYVRHRNGFAFVYEALTTIVNTIHAEHPDLDTEQVTTPYLPRR